LRELGVDGAVIGVSPGAAYGDAKRWLPERFAESARAVAAALGATVLVFGSAAERELCEAVTAGVRGGGVDARNLAGGTTLTEFIDLAAACRLYLTNDSGAMHVASALGVPTVAVFGATDDVTTGPTGPLVRVVREHAECSPCLLRDCPIDHRCMTRVTPDRVAAVSLELINSTAETWTHEPKS
jgi:heptosyltransferase-2